MTSEFVAVECAVRQLHARYVDAIWRQDAPAVGALFAPDGEWRVGGQVMRGPAEVERFIAGAFRQFKRILMTFRTPILELGDGVASARTYVTEHSIYADGRPFAPIGIYFDRFVEIEGQWLFQWRMFQTHYTGPPELTGTLYDVADYGPPPGMPPLDETTFDRSGVGGKAAKG